MILIQQNYQINPNEREESLSWFGIAYISKDQYCCTLPKLKLDIFTEFDADSSATHHIMAYTRIEGMKE